jgi:site-specific recombinase XerD
LDPYLFGSSCRHPELAIGRDSTNVNDFALVAMLGLLGPRVFEATGSPVEAIGEARGHRVLKVQGKGDKPALVPLPPAVGRAIDQADPSARADRSCRTATTGGWTGTRSGR